MKLSDLPTSTRPGQGTDDRPAAAAAPESAKDQALRLLWENLGPRLTNPRLSEAELMAVVSAELNEIVNSLQVPLTHTEKMQLLTKIVDDALRLGPLEDLLNDQTIAEIMVNAHDKVWIERAGKMHLSGVRFENDAELLKIIERIVTRVGRRIDESSPFVDARLADGSRVNAIIPPLALNGPSLTIRKFPANPLTMDDLIRKQTLSESVAQFLSGCVRGKINTIVSGGTGTGKTTLLNILSSYIPEDERVISIEDAAELQLKQANQVRLESRPPNVEGKGAVAIRELVSNSLRMRPNRIVVGECRGGEALDMLQAMNTGHDGSMSTIHANSPRDALSRLETLVLMAGTDLPSRAIREQIASAIQLLVQISRMSDGTRRITSITEVVGNEGGVISTQDLFVFKHLGMDERGGVRGRLVPTGIRPRFTQRLADLGILFGPDMFQEQYT